MSTPIPTCEAAFPHLLLRAEVRLEKLIPHVHLTLDQVLRLRAVAVVQVESVVEAVKEDLGVLIAVSARDPRD